MSDSAIAPLERVGINLAAAVERAEAVQSPRVPRRTLLISAGFAALVLLAAVPTYITLGGHRIESLSTAEAIDQVAQAATDNPLPFARSDQFQYTRSRGTYAWSFGGGYNPVTKKTSKSYSALVTSERKAWISLDRFGAMSEKRLGIEWVTAQDRRSARAQKGKPSFGPRSRTMGVAPDRHYYFLGKEMTRSQLENAPTDPKIIYERTLKNLNGAGQGPADGVWEALTGYLYEYSYPAAVRAGMVRALGLIPGVKTLGRMRDPLGREGIAFSREHWDTRDVILFDDANSAVMFRRSAIFRKSSRSTYWPIGTTVEEYLAYERRVVDEIPPAVRKRLPRPQRPVGTGVQSSVGIADN